MMMGFSKMSRSIACMLLMVVFANARNQPLPNSSSAVSVDTHCSVENLESRLVSIEEQLSRTLRIVSTLSNPLINANCTVDLASFGYDDSTKHGYVRTSGGSSEEVYTPERIDRNRGVTVFELDATNCIVLNRQRYDTYEHAEERVQLLETLESAKSGTIVVGVTADAPESLHHSAFRNVVGSFFTKYNMNLAGLETRDKFAFIMQKGYPKKTIFQRKVRFGDSLRMKVALRGSIVSAVNFIQV